MKRKNNYLPSDDVNGQLCLTGCEITVRVPKPTKPKPIKPIKSPQKPRFIISDSELARLKKTYKYELYCFYKDLESCNTVPDNVGSMVNPDLRIYNMLISKHLKNIGGSKHD